MDDIHVHKHIIRRRHSETYRKVSAPEIGVVEPKEEILDIRLVKLIFVSMIAVVAYGLSWLVFAL